MFCGSDTESVAHVLIWCPFVWRVWAEMLVWWDIQAAIPGSVECLLWWWAGEKLKKKEKMIWRVIPLAVMWSVWKCRNECVFRKTIPNLEDLCDLIKYRVAFWLKHVFSEFNFSVQDYVFKLRQVRECLRGCVGMVY